MLWYRLDGDKVSACSEPVMQGMEERRLARTETPNGCVSTVFLSLDHSHGDSTPVLFETMVFGGALDEECTRYTTYYAAMEGHYRKVRELLGELE